jgi:endonuclease-3
MSANTKIDDLVRVLKVSSEKFGPTAITKISYERDPFMVMISCLLSLRTKDNVTAAASERLFALATTPEGMLGLSTPDIEGAIYPVGFYRRILGLGWVYFFLQHLREGVA